MHSALPPQPKVLLCVCVYTPAHTQFTTSRANWIEFGVFGQLRFSSAWLGLCFFWCASSGVSSLCWHTSVVSVCCNIISSPTHSCELSSDLLRLCDWSFRFANCFLSPAASSSNFPSSSLTFPLRGKAHCATATTAAEMKNEKEESPGSFILYTYSSFYNIVKQWGRERESEGKSMLHLSFVRCFVLCATDDDDDSLSLSLSHSRWPILVS